MTFTLQFQPFIDRPLIHQSQDPRLAGNVNGPSLIRVPEWVENRLGNYYLYFAHHEGDSIRLAVADHLTDVWQIVWPPALTLADSGFPTTPPDPADLHEEARYWISTGGDGFYPHIASPDIIVDEAQRQIRMYYHGRLPDGRQRTQVAVSADGRSFTPRPDIIAGPYLRMFRHDNQWYGIAMPGELYRSADGLTHFEVGPTLFDNNERHYALLKRDNQLIIFWSRAGDTPERILASVVDLSADWADWRTSDPIEVHRPVRDWEGANLPLEPSRFGTSMEPVHQLRDPAIYEENGSVYLLYSVQGEQGIGIGQLQLS